MDEQQAAFQMIPRQLAEKIPTPLPDGRRAGAVLQLVPRPKNRPFGPRIEPLGIEQGALVMVAEQAHLALRDFVDHFTRIRTIADQIAETIDLGNSLVSNVGQHRLEALDIAVDIANEGSFHASRLSDVGGPRDAAGNDRRASSMQSTVYCGSPGRSSRDASCESPTNPTC